MEGIFTEFENENELRTYPFASGCIQPEDSEDQIPVGVFVDAAIYPINPVGIVYLSGISDKGVFSISDDSGVIMSGSANGDMVEFYDVSTFSRHVGTLQASSKESLAEFAGRGVEREYNAENTAFASSCVFPIVIDGVVSVDIGSTGSINGDVAFLNSESDTIRVCSSTREDGRDTLRFDVLPRPGIPDGDFIKRIICVVDGQTPFRIAKQKYINTNSSAENGEETEIYNVIVIWLDSIDKGAVCTAAHRENQYEMADTCHCDKTPLPSEDEIEEVYHLEEVYIPPDETGAEDGLKNGADNAFYLISPNMAGYDNPISITLEDGPIIPNTEGIETVTDGGITEVADGALLDNLSSKSVIIQVPGLSGGKV